METINLENLAKKITGLNIKIFIPDNPNDKYTYYNRFNGVLSEETVYGVQIDDCIEYTFKTTKKVETFFKSFINQHIRKYEMKQGFWGYIDDSKNLGWVYPKKETIVKKLISDRVSKYHYYTTLYGIGMFAYFTRDVKNATKNLSEYLDSKNINYTNEFSEAGWVYRFVINSEVKNHNKLLENFNI